MNRVLAISSEVPWPLNSGGHLRTFHLLRSIASHWDVRLVCPLAKGCPDPDVPIDAGFELVSVPVPSRSLWSEAYRFGRARMRREPYAMYRRHDHPAMHHALEREMATFDPDVIWFDHLDSAVYLSHAGRATRVIDLHNVYSLILDRLAEESSVPKRWLLRQDARHMRSVERSVCREVDLVCAVSDQEADYFRDYGAENVCVIPNGVDCSRFAPNRTPGSPTDVPRLLFLGAMNWQPNVNAARFLAQELFPSLRQSFPLLELDLVGRDPTQDIQQLGSVPGVNVTGTVPDVGEYLRRATLFVVPLDSGGGTRLKILEAFAAGVPVVSSAIGAEGIAAVDKVHLRIVERQNMLSGIAEMLAKPNHNDMVDAARCLVEQTYDWAIVGKQAIGAVDSLLCSVA